MAEFWGAGAKRIRNGRRRGLKRHGEFAAEVREEAKRRRGRDAMLMRHNELFRGLEGVAEQVQPTSLAESRTGFTETPSTKALKTVTSGASLRTIPP